MPRREEEQETSSERGGMEKEIFMRARAGNINISFPTEREAQDWEDRLVSKLKDEGYKISSET